VAIVKICFHVAGAAIFLSTFVVTGCGSSSDPSIVVRPSASQTAGKVKAGMTTQEVEKAMGGKGAVDPKDPTSFHFPTADGDVIVTYANGAVASVTTQGDR